MTSWYCGQIKVTVTKYLYFYSIIVVHINVDFTANFKYKQSKFRSCVKYHVWANKRWNYICPALTYKSRHRTESDSVSFAPSFLPWVPELRKLLKHDNAIAKPFENIDIINIIQWNNLGLFFRFRWPVVQILLEAQKFASTYFILYQQWNFGQSCKTNLIDLLILMYKFVPLL